MAPAVDIVTLENFEEKMPPWDQAQENHLYALVDMGRCVNLSYRAPSFLPNGAARPLAPWRDISPYRR